MPTSFVPPARGLPTSHSELLRRFLSANLKGTPRLLCSSLTSSKVFPRAAASLRMSLLRDKNIKWERNMPISRRQLELVSKG